MARNNAVNLDVTNNEDGFTLGGGETTRFVSVISGDVTLTGGGEYTHVFPNASGTLALTSDLGAIPGQSGGADGKVLRYSAPNTWTEASTSDTTDELTVLLFKQNSRYYTTGSLINGLSGLTPGSVYYLATSGDVSTSPSAVVIGKAISTTSLLFVPGS